MDQAPATPPGWIFFLIMFGAICLFAAFLYINARIHALINGEPWGGPQQKRTRSTVRSKVLKQQLKRSNRSNTANQGSPRQNAEKPSVQRSDVQVQRSEVIAPVISNDLPASIEELQRLAHAITLYAQRPNKQLAIEAAWNCTKGGSGEWERASKLFDKAMEGQARHVAKAKQPQAEVMATGANVG